MSALIYQTTWFREFRLIFGASTAATAAVMATFMGGVGWGSLVLGRKADRQRSPLKLYGGLELMIAVTAALSPLFLMGVRAVYLAMAGGMALGMAGNTALRLVLGGAVLLVPTFLMGGTLPAAAAALWGGRQAHRWQVALCYGANAAGAVVGVGCATFWLLEAVGNRGTLWIGCGLNVLAALAALRLAKKEHPVPQPEDAPAALDDASSAAVPSPEGQLPPAWIYATAWVTGFSFFLMELVWYRMLAPILGEPPLRLE